MVMVDRILVTVLATVLLLSAAGAAHGQDAATVPIWDPAYEDLSRLADSGLLPDLIQGQRPLSVGRVASLAVQAREGLAGLEALQGRDAVAGLRVLVERLELRFPTAAGGAASLRVRDVLVDLAGADRKEMARPGDNGRGLVDDVIDPILAYRQGRRQPGDYGAGFEVSVLAASPTFAAEYRPRAQWGHRSAGEADESASQLDTRRLYLRVRLGKWALRAGRDAIAWTQGDRVGLLLSTNPRGLDMVELATDTPVRLPGFLGGLGPTAVTVFGADLGSGQNFPHAKLVGVRLGVRPHDRLELGFAYLNKQGGKGAPEASLSDRILDVLVLPDIVRDEADYEISEKLLGGDLRWRFAGATPAAIYVEGILTDFDVGRLGQILWGDGAWNVGLFLPSLGPSGLWWLRLEGQHVGSSVYRHGQFTSGLTLDGDLLGSALGPDADGARLALGRDMGTVVVTTGLEFEARQNHLYTATPEPDFRVILVEERPVERRTRFVGSWTRYVDGRSGWIQVEAGAERVTGSGFQEGEVRNNAFARLSFVHRIR
ncbi:MAG TPA: capsule assembly Wzi family protein [Longimicrobiales bacterium]|jgi:hypothetical protein